MKKFIPLTILFTTCLCVFATQVVKEIATDATSIGLSSELINKYEKALPQVSGVSLSGKTIDLKKELPQILVLNFWASWCAPCKEELPSLVKFQKKYKDKVVVIGINNDEKIDKSVKKILNEYKLNFDSIHDPQNKITTDLFGFYDIPMSLLFVKGKLTYYGDGKVEFMKKEFISKVESNIVKK